MNWGNRELLMWLPVWLAVVWALFWALGRRQRALGKIADGAVAGEMTGGWDAGAGRRRLWWRVGAMSLVLVGLARPQWGSHWEEVSRKGLDVAVVLDTSRSMMATDMAPSRLQQAKWGIRDLLRRLKGDRVALVPFAGSSVVQCPLTTDYAAFAMTLDDVYCGLIPKGGTAVEQALRTAAEVFPEDGGRAAKVVLLITDGEDHEGDPMRMVEELKKRDIRVYAIGIGTLEGELVPGEEQSGYFKDRKGQVVRTALREDVLQKLAVETGGTYVRSAPGDTGLERLFDESLSKLERDERNEREVMVHEERFGWALGAGLAMLAAESASGLRRRGNKREAQA